MSPKYGADLTVDVVFDILHVVLGFRPDELEVELTRRTPCVGLAVAAGLAAVAATDAPDEVGTPGFEDSRVTGGSSNRPRNIGMDVVSFFFCVVFSDSLDI